MPTNPIVSHRIKSIVNEIDFESIADIGCDHGLISIHALITGQIKRAIACDINTGPVQRAMNNIKKYSANEIQVRKGYGLDMLAPGEADTVVIAGMGGMLIIEILKKAAPLPDSIKQLVLQPQHDIPEVRKYAHLIGFMIKNEVILKDEGKYYNIINCHIGSDSKYTDRDYLLGKLLIERKDNVLLEYLRKEIKLLEDARGSIKSAGVQVNTAAALRMENIERLLSIYGELVTCR